MAICPSCGEENPDRFRLCGFCGTPLHPEEAPREIRKTVTIVFSDLVGSTAIGERLDSESLRAVMSRYFDVMRAELERHGGTVEKFIGDAVMAVFGLPNLHEDDAERAVRAAAGMQAALEGLNAELDARFGVTLKNRTGVNTGEVVSGDPTAGQRLVTGDAVNVAARLEQAAGTNEVLIGPLTRELVAHVTELEAVEPLELKGKSEPMPAFRLLGVRSAAPARGRSTRLVGRDEELATLRSELAEVAGSGSARLVVIEAVAGAGKSRLVAEFLESVPEGTTDHPRALPVVRPGDHVLAGRGGPARAGGHPRRRPPRRGAGQARRPRGRRPGRGRAHRGRRRAHRRRLSGRRALLGGAPRARQPRRLRPPGGRVRGSALGGADHARPGRAPRRDAGSGARPLHDA